MCHGVPFSVPLLIFRDVVQLGEDKQEDRYNVDNDQVPVTASVQGLVVVAVDVVGYDVPKLNHH